MKINKEVRLAVELGADEIASIENTRLILNSLLAQMKTYHCETIITKDYDDTYTYDISDLETTIEELEFYTNITEVCN